MRTHTKIVIVTISLNLLIPSASLAQSSYPSGYQSYSPSPQTYTTQDSAGSYSSSSPEPSSQVRPDPAKFCLAATQVHTRITNETSARTQKLKSFFTTQSQALVAKRTDLDMQLANNRLKSDLARTDQFHRLETIATTDKQKMAIMDYEAVVQTAIVAHRASIDQANKTFLDALFAAIERHQSNLITAATAYQNSTALSTTQATSNCRGGMSPLTVRHDLSLALKVDQAKFVTARQSADKSHADLTNLTNAHQMAIKAADASFHNALKAALTQLTQVLNSSPTSTTSPSPSPFR